MSIDLLQAKMRAIIESIDKMSETERSGRPTANFGEDYNRLRSAVESARPDVSALLPPAVGVTNTNAMKICDTRYSEIRAYCDQLLQMLSTKPS